MELGIHFNATTSVDCIVCEDNRLCLLHACAKVEYAIEAIKLGSTAVGIQTKEGVVLAVEKRLTSPLLEPSSVEKVSYR